jgi:hypothetical protein
MTGRVEVSFASFEAPDVAGNRIEVSWAAFEAPDAGNRVLVSWASFEAPDAASGSIGGAWIEPRQAEKASKKAEREKREAWRRIEEDIEEAYARATGKPRKQVKPVVREALAARDPETVKRIAEQLSVSTDPAAVALTQRIDARVSEIEQLALLIAEVEQAMAFARMRDEDEAIALLLMAD